MALRGFAKKKIPKIRDYYGSGWMGPGLTRNYFCGKSSQNSPKQVLTFCGVVHAMCILSVHTLLKRVGYYDLICCVRVSDVFKKSLDWGWVSEVSSIQFFFGFLEFV